MRSVPEWIGSTDDARPPRRVRARVFERYVGRCQCGCGNRIAGGEAWDADHVIALCNGGENRETNLVPVLREHHRAKTARDVATKAKTARVKAKHIGIGRSTRNPMPCGRRSAWKKKITGEVVRR